MPRPVFVFPQICLLESLSVDVAERCLSWVLIEPTNSLLPSPHTRASPTLDEEGGSELLREHVLSESELKAGLEENLDYDTSVIGQVNVITFEDLENREGALYKLP